MTMLMKFLTRYIGHEKRTLQTGGASALLYLMKSPEEGLG